MKVTIIDNVDEDGKGSYGVRIGNFRLVICSGEPEDNTFYRDLNDAYSLLDLIKVTYEAGKKGEELIFE